MQALSFPASRSWSTLLLESPDDHLSLLLDTRSNRQSLPKSFIPLGINNSELVSFLLHLLVGILKKINLPFNCRVTSTVSKGKAEWLICFLSLSVFIIIHLETSILQRKPVLLLIQSWIHEIKQNRNVFSPLQLYSFWCSFVPTLASGSPFKLAPESFGRLQSWAAPWFLIWKYIYIYCRFIVYISCPCPGIRHFSKEP